MQWTWDIYPAFEVGGLVVRWYSVIFALVLLVGWMLTVWQFLRGGREESAANWVVGLGIVGTFVGGRLGHLLFYEFERFVADPTLFFAFREGGVASHGATVGILLACIVFARGWKIPFAEVTDRLTPAACVGAAFVRLGNLFNSEVVGRATDQTWGVRFPYYDHSFVDAPYRHPSQVYEFVLGLVVFAIVMLVDRRLGESRPRGLMTALFLGLYFPARFAVEFVKEYQALDPDALLTMGQWLSIAPALAGWVALVFVWRKHVSSSRG